MTYEALGLESIDHWTPARHTDVIKRIRELEERGVFIGVPADVDVRERDTLPVVCFLAARTDQPHPEAFPSQGVVVLESPATSRVWAALIQQPVDKRVEEDDDGPQPEFSVLTVYRQASFDARERVPELPWQDDVLLATVLLHDAASNRVKVTLRGAEVEAPQTTPVPPQPWPPLRWGAAPYWREAPGAPAVPADEGVQIAVAPQLDPGAREALLVGSYRLLLAPEQRLPGEGTPERKAAMEAGWTPPRDPEIVGVVPINLVFVGTRAPKPKVVQVQAAVYSDDGEYATGTFAIDLFNTPGVPRGAQGYHVTAFAGGHLSGPHPFEVSLS